jgi:hypothetical protein
VSTRPVTPLVAAALACAMLALPNPAAAQGGNHSVFVAGTAGADGSTSGTYDAGPELGGFVGLEFARHALSLRGDVGVGLWDLDAPGAGAPGSVQRLRIAGSVIKAFGPFGRSRRWSAFVGGGAGVYLYRADGRSNDVAPSVHGLGGIECLLPHASRRWSVGAEAQFQRLDAPDDPRGAGWLSVVRAGGFVKYKIKAAWARP